MVCTTRVWRALGLFVLCFLVFTAASQAAGVRLPSRQDIPVEGRRLSARQATDIAKRSQRVGEKAAHYKGAQPTAYLKDPGQWQVSYFIFKPKRKEVVQVIIDDASGRILEVWTGYKIPWTMARGYPGAFGRKVNAPWVWIPLAVLFVLSFFDFKRFLRLFHLDLMFFSVLSVAFAFFNAGKIEYSTPLVFVSLLYFFVRLVAIAIIRSKRYQGDMQSVPDASKESPLKKISSLPLSWLMFTVVFLFCFRVALNVFDSNVIDVGYSGIIGADKLAHGQPLYGSFPADNQHGDTYGSLLYFLYIPFELVFPWRGGWTHLDSAHAAAIAFDLMTCCLCFFAGVKLGGKALGVILTYAWTAFPFTLLALNTNTNDSLVAVVCLAMLLAAFSPFKSGVAAMAAGLTKFAPFILAPLLFAFSTSSDNVEHSGRFCLKRALRFVTGFSLAAFILLLPILLKGNLDEMFQRTLGFQADRNSPFSIWGLYGWESARTVVQIFVAGFALIVMPFAKRLDHTGLAAVMAALLIAAQLTTGYWFFLYIVWFFPLAFLVLAKHTSDVDSEKHQLAVTK